MKFNVCVLLLFVILVLTIPAAGNTNIKTNEKQNDNEYAISTAESTPLPAKNEISARTSAEYYSPVWEVVRHDEYDGEFRIYNQSTGKVERINYKDYVRGAICAEMSPEFHPEALKAQGVAALTYALYNQKMHRGKDIPALHGADFAADPLNWKGFVTKEIAKDRYGEKFDIYWSKICNAADEASQKIIIYDDAPILAAYHSTSSGITEAAENVWNHSLPYLTPVSSRGDLLAPGYETELTLSVQQFKEIALNSISNLTLGSEPNDWIEVLDRSEGGYVTSVRVGNQIIHGKKFRSILQLRSSNFTITCDGKNFYLTVCGYGHGVGLSQYGADFMAMQGSSSDEILCYYFTGAKIVSADEYIK